MTETICIFGAEDLLIIEGALADKISSLEVRHETAAYLMNVAGMESATEWRCKTEALLERVVKISDTLNRSSQEEQ